MGVSGQYSFWLVALSILIAIVASYTALDLAGRIRASVGGVRAAWLGTAALAMGGGIWAMHFVGMLAFHMHGVDMAYEPGLTLVSLLIAVAATGLGFSVTARSNLSIPVYCVAGLFMGLGIAAMHYTGMAAMRISAQIRFDPAWIIISVLIAVVASTVALGLSARTHSLGAKAIAAVAMGAAVAGMHYAGMVGVIFIPYEGLSAPTGAALTAPMLAIGISTATLLILLLGLVAAMVDRRLALMAEREAAALRSSEERFRQLYKRTPLPLYALDESGALVHVSDAWLALLGYSRSDVVGRRLINFMTESSARQMIDVDWPALLREGVVIDAEYRVVARNGTFLDVVGSMSIDRDQAGAPLLVLGGLTDITERKRAEDALRQAQRLEAIGQLTGGVAHDFNNLLSVILGNLELLTRRPQSDPKALKLVESARQGALRGASLTQRLLAFARKQELRPEAVEVPALVHGMSELLRRSLGPRVQVETQFPLGLRRVHVDAHQLELTLLNLALNSRDAMPDGGLITLAAMERDTSGDNVLPSGRYVCIAVTDTGTGMDAATLARATEPFFTTKGVGKGTGLGLSMAQGLAEQSGGRLELTSALGRGTTVTLWLPVAAETPTPVRDAPQSEESETSGTSLRIMVVDDDPLVLAQVRAMLEELGHAVCEACSGEEALRLLSEVESLDLLLTDYLMPGMTGRDLAEVVRTRRPEIPVLMMSAFADLPSGAPVLERLAKPFTLQQLASAIAAIQPLAGGGNVTRLDQFARPRTA